MDKTKTKDVKSKGFSKKTKESDPGETSKNEAILKSKLKEKHAKSESDTDDERRGPPKEATQKRSSKGKLFGKKTSDDKKSEEGTGPFRRKSKGKAPVTEENPPPAMAKESTPEKEIVTAVEKLSEKLFEPKEEEKKETHSIPSVKKPTISAEEKSIISEALHQIENAGPVNPPEKQTSKPASPKVPEIPLNENVGELRMMIENKNDEIQPDVKQGTQMGQVVQPEDYAFHIIEDIAKQAVEENPAEKTVGNKDENRYL